MKEFISKIEDFIGEKIILKIMEFLASNNIWLVTGILVGAAILILVGFIVIIKKWFKGILIIGILALIGYVIYYYIQNKSFPFIPNQNNTTAGSVNGVIEFAQVFLTKLPF